MLRIKYKSRVLTGQQAPYGDQDAHLNIKHVLMLVRACVCAYMHACATVQTQIPDPWLYLTLTFYSSDEFASNLERNKDKVIDTGSDRKFI